MLTKLDRLKGYSPRETCVALLSMLAILLFWSASAVAQTSIVVSQKTWGANETNSAATFGTATVSTSGGAWGAASPGGHSAAVNSFGVFVTGTSTGGFVEQFTNQNSVMTVVGESGIAPGGMAIDRNNYLYISGEASNIVYKIPVNPTATGSYGEGTYGPINSVAVTTSSGTSYEFETGAPGTTGAAPPPCAGDGSSPDASGICQINLGNGTYGFNVASLAVDSNHNLYFTTDGNAGTATPSAPYSVFKCSTACLYPASGTTPPGPVQIFVEPASVAPACTGQLYTGAIAVDPKDNVYFTDSCISNSGSSAGYSTSSDLYQLAVDSSNTDGYAATPTILATLTPACATTGTPCTDAITTVATDSTGNVYFATELDGVFEIANNGSVLAGNPPVVPISGEGVKTILPDGNGNFYFVSNNPTTTDDTAGFLAVGSVVDTAQAWYVAGGAGAGSVSNVSAVDPEAGCSSASALSFSEAEPYGFSGPQTTSCTTLPFESSFSSSSSGSSFPVTVTFSPTSTETGPYNTTMTATNAADGNTGTFPVSGTAAITQTITLVSPTTASNKETFGVAPVALEATASSGLPVIFTTTTPTICTGLNTDSVTFIDNGTCTVQANQPGNSLYAPAATKTITFTVSALSPRLTDCSASSTAYTTSPIPLCATSTNTTSTAEPICFTLGTVSTSNGTVNPGTGPGGCEPGQTLTITGTGSVDLAVSQAAVPGWSATSATFVVKVTPAPQIIVFTTPATIMYGSTLNLVATGGPSGNPVTFALDPATTGYTSSTASTVATLSGTNNSVLTVSNSALSGNTLGTIVIDASQAASALSGAETLPNYAASPSTTAPVTPQVQAFLTVTPVVNPTNPFGAATTPVISPASGSTLYMSGGANVVTIADTLAGASICYTTDGSTPIVNGVCNVSPGTATVYTAPFPLTASATVIAMALAPGYAVSQVASATYTVSTTAANFTAAVAPASVTVSPSSPGIVDITVTSQYGFNSATTFTCSTVPSNLTCSFNPATVTPAVGQSASTALTLTESGSAALEHRSNPFLPGGAAFALSICLLGWKKRRGLFLALVLIVGVIGVTQLTGCGSSGGAKATTSNVVVSAASGSVTQTIQIAVTVNP
jgi:hypothetical protein